MDLSEGPKIPGNLRLYAETGIVSSPTWTPTRVPLIPSDEEDRSGPGATEEGTSPKSFP